MNITRNGQAIELTPEEIEKIYRQRDREYHMEDVKLYLENNKLICPYDESDLNAIAERAEDNLGSYDMYWDCYWYAFANAIKEYNNV